MNKPTPLFRQEALDHKRDTWLGDMLLTRPTSFAWLTAFFLVIAILSLVYLVWGEYTKKARVAGYLVPDQGLIKLYAQTPGPVVALQVKEGQNVKRGDVLAIISTERINSGGVTQLEIAKQLDIRKTSLNDGKSKLEKIYAEQINSAQRRALQIDREVAQLGQAAQAQQQLIDLASSVVTRNKQLHADNFVSELVLQQRQGELLEQQNKLREIERVRSTLERERLTLQTELASLPERLQNETASFDRQIAEITGNSVENEARRQDYVIAPQDGIVTALQIDIGKQASTSLPLLSIIPAGARLQVDLYMPSRAAGFVKVGSQARLQYQALPLQNLAFILASFAKFLALLSHHKNSHSQHHPARFTTSSRLCRRKIMSWPTVSLSNCKSACRSMPIFG
ncbi:MAG: HlyD family efflux transporter periplasmic adaptor subunit [Brachymonas sp.]|nr:HlyD family efflux transporter periplasmic adaptor subunit [Brachymonas sp.]